VASSRARRSSSSRTRRDDGVTARFADAIVIGGGVAGLAAAAELGRRGRRVILLEARDRLGGRVFTARPKGWRRPVELGAEFIHAGNDELWRVIRRHRLKTVRVPGGHWRFADGALQRVDDLAERLERVTGRIAKKKMAGWSFARFLRTQRELPASDRELAAGFVEGFEAAPMDEMSASAMAGETLDDAHQFIFPKGYDALVSALEADARRAAVHVMLDAAVKRVDWRRGAVHVHSRGGSFGAACAVVTVPLGVLQTRAPQRGAIVFAPALRAKGKLVARMRMGHVLRLTLRFDGRAWSQLVPEPLARAARGGFGFIHSRIDGVPVWWSLHGDSSVTGWAGGPAAVALCRKSENAVRDRALHSLGRVLNTSVAGLRRALNDWTMHHWSRDPFSRGAYSYVVCGHDDAAEKLAKAIGDTLFFAGEATAPRGETGTVHGALASGLRAAGEVRRALEERANRRPGRRS
jgi:monoamine oxidase